MRVMTFEEWCWANHDLMEDLRAHLHPCGLSYGQLEAVDAEEAYAYIYGTLHREFAARRARDEKALKAWNEAVTSVGVS